MAMFIIVAVIIIVILIFYHCMPFILQQVRLFKSSLRFPGPKAYPLIGNLNLFIGDNAKIWNTITKMFVIYTRPSCFWLAYKLYFGISDPDNLKTILTNPHTQQKAEYYKLLKVLIGNGLLTAPVEIWRRHRKLIIPTFNMKVLESFTPVFSKISLNVAKKLESELHKDGFDIFKYTSNFSVSSICENTMGIDMTIESGKNDLYVKAATRVLDIITLRIFKPWFHLDIIFNFTSLSAELSKHLKYMHTVSDEIIKKKELEFKSKDSVEHNATRKMNLLSLLMELSNTGNTFTHQELQDEVDTMILAGTDTSATTLSFVLLMIAMFPEVQDQVYQELYHIYGSSDPADKPVTYEDLKYFEYMDRVIKETLRHFPVGGIIARDVMEDVKLVEGVLPKGSTVILGIYAVHHNDKYWPNPFKFDPDRFLPENVKGRHPYCYLPFSAGPRNCLGMKYADMSMKVLLGTLVRKFIFKQDKYKTIVEIMLKLEIVLKSIETITLRIEKRN